MSGLYIGIMSGTSLDAIDAVIIDFNLAILFTDLGREYTRYLLNQCILL